MRLRPVLAVAAGALLITMSVPNSASAATGEFQYRGPLLGSHTLIDPPDQECINIGEATNLLPAQSPRNLTTSTATIFLDFDCDGDTFTVLNPGQSGGILVKFRSVVFS
ncbi:hypothetical protein BV881_29125 [Streptomyces sp. ZL-24]|uniref:hypothetical protein n=1 Tax=Streptomyces sp. ZL-24 TaxID=1933029 RepID=UPI000CD3F2F1|nr:hypothetical protein [Streptomyces sp. ZL-24]POG44001.1 hypothetical protein BV881_29125 [Streptomyces sp. ZL-24]